jgi:hypothetical protein
MNPVNDKGVTLPRSETVNLLMRALILIEKDEKEKKSFREIRCPKHNNLLCKTNGTVKVWCRKCSKELEFDGSGRLVTDIIG